MDNLTKMNRAIKQIPKAKTTEEFNKIRERIYKYRDKVMLDAKKEKDKMERKKIEIRRQAKARQTRIKGEIREIKSKKLIMQNSMMKKPRVDLNSNITFNPKKK